MIKLCIVMGLLIVKFKSLICYVSYVLMVLVIEGKCREIKDNYGGGHAEKGKQFIRWQVS